MSSVDPCAGVPRPESVFKKLKLVSPISSQSFDLLLRSSFMCHTSQASQRDDSLASSGDHG
jgi:hypothetical protein